MLVVCSIGTVVVYKNVHYFFHREKFLSSSQVIISQSSNVQGVSVSSRTPGTKRPSTSSPTKGNAQSNRATGSKAPPTVSQSANNSSTHQSTSPNATYAHTPAVRKQGIQDAEKLNVIIMGTDSASRLNMLRHLSKTYEYLTKELGALDLKGYNKVGDNTFPNIVAILGGYTVDEMEKEACVTESRHYDDCHWVWNDFKKNHYVTAYMEVSGSRESRAAFMMHSIPSKLKSLSDCSHQKTEQGKRITNTPRSCF